MTIGQASLRLGAPGAKPRKFPYIKLSSWMRHLLETDQLPMQMTGVANFDTMRVVLKEFWKRHRAINPSFALFQLADSEELSLDLCIPYFSHSDEGRSYKHLGKKYINIPSEKYIYIYAHKYVYIHTYVKWMNTGLMLACLKKWMQSCLIQSYHKNGCSPVSCHLVIKMDAVLPQTILS